MYKTAFNTTEQPVSVDAEGHAIGGQSWGPVDTTNDEVKNLLESGTIVLVERPGDDADVNPEAAAAFEATDRLAELSKRPADEVKAEAIDAGLADEDEPLTKDDAVEKLGRSGKGK